MQNYTLYIHGSNDVIRSVQIDLAEVYAAPQNDWQRAATEAMAREIAAQIERLFPKSQASRALTTITPIVKFMNFATGGYLDGIVVPVPGVIDEPVQQNTPPGIATAQVQKQIEQLKNQYEQVLQKERAIALAQQTKLENDLATRQQELAAAQASLQMLRPREKRLQQALQQEEQRRMDLEARVQEMGLRIAALEQQLQQAKKKLSTSSQDIGELKIKVQTLQQQQSANEQARKLLEEDKQTLEGRLINKEKERQRLSKVAMETKATLEEVEQRRAKIQSDYDEISEKYNVLLGRGNSKNGANEGGLLSY
jgi:hypothetical protein